MPAFGLRPRLLATLVLTSAVSLGFAAFALLTPLKDRLRTDGTATVLAAVGAAKLSFEEIDITRGRLDMDELRRQVRTLESRTSARVSLFDDRLAPVIGGDVDPSPPDLQALGQDLRGDKLVRASVGSDLLVLQPLQIGSRRYVLAVRKHLAYVQQASRVVGDVFVKAALVGLVVALLLGAGLSATMLRRLERLRDATRELDEHGLGASPPPSDSSRDEIGELTRAFAGMHARLRQQEDARRAFVATASHELRTPLTSLDGMLELVADDLETEPLDIEDARGRLAQAKEQSRRLANLAADLLDLSRIDAAIALRSEPVELVELARAVTAEFDQRAGQREVTVEIVPPETPCWAEGDPGSVARILRILLDNALRFAPAGSTVIVGLGGDQRFAVLEVRDRGPGVLAQERELIFERFKRGTGRGGEGGFGLGLAIGRELAGRMGGSLELCASDAGAVFRLRLATARVPVEA
ncbi:MAG: two-component system, OmpR family, sensor histidine kinase MprB [Solirubrobacteraceae bacterium]|nr:two-component system, OmpR family, sensor histidine kinase MprB [Solirubrobacteraceae bacterium]